MKRILLLSIVITPLALLALDRLSEPHRLTFSEPDPGLARAFSFPARPMPPRPPHAVRLSGRQHDQTPAPEDTNVFWAENACEGSTLVDENPQREPLRVIESELSANEDRARASLRQQIDRHVSDWLSEAGLPRDWQVPSVLVNHMIREQPSTVLAEDRGYGPLYRSSVAVDFSLSHKTLLVREYQRQLASRRLGQMTAVLAFVLACLAVLSGYIHTDEATRGYYTTPLRVLATAAVGASAFALYQVLS